ncbi:MAG TPA: T9SS type A sorting domain-containing protein [Flavobacteriales bacterium]|nr:T9SS type A sorting domain-containing protein [Flavobacteriales bacterium]
MNKLYFACIFSLLFYATSFAQNDPPSIHWEKNINGIVPATNPHIKTVRDASGNLYALCNSEYDFKVIKFNPSGLVVNTYTYNNPYNQDDTPYDILVDALENVYVCGSSFSDYKYYNTIVKFNASGSLAWSQSLLTGNTWIYMADVAARAMALDNSGNVLYTGTMNDSLTIGKILADGSLDFVKTVFIDGIGIGTGMDVVTDASGAFFVAGHVNNVSGNSDCVIFKADASGNFLWRKKYVGLANADEQATVLGIDNSSNLYIAGYVADVSSTNTTATLVKLNASGAEQWTKNLFETGQLSGTTSTLYVDGIGQTYIATNIKTSATQSYTRIYKHNSVGIQEFAVTIDDATMNENITSSIDVDLSGNVFAAGYNPSSFNCYYTKYSGTGSLSWYYVYTSSTFFNNPVAIFADNSSSPNVIATVGNNLNNIRYNPTGIFQFETVYSSLGNQTDAGLRIITQGNQSVYGLGTITNGSSQRDIMLGKYNTQGNILWQNIIDYSGTDNEAYDFDNDALYNIYTVGSGSSSTWHSKYDSIGSPLFANNYPGAWPKIMVDNSGNSYLAGNNNSGIKFSVKKVNTTGGISYSNVPAGSTDTTFTVNAIEIDASNRIYVGGQRFSETGAGPAMNTHCVVQKFGPTGSLLWTRVINHNDSTSAYAFVHTKIVKVLVDASNDVYVMGQSDGFTLGDYNFTFVIKLDNTGAQIWRRDFDGAGTMHEEAGDMMFSSAGTLLVYSNGNFNHVLRRLDKTDGSTTTEVMEYDSIEDACKIDENGIGEVYVAGNRFTLATLRDYSIAKFDAGLNHLWTKNYSNNYVGSDEVADMKVTGNNRVYVTGRSFSTPGVNADYNLIKLCDILPPVITSSGPYIDICPGNSVSLTSNGNFYLWSNGSTSDTISVNSNGSYFCTVLKSDGCAKNTDTLTVTVKAAPITPEICLVTVDDSSTHNIVYWDKTGYTNVNYFNIYREDFTSTYTLVAAVPYDSLSEYHDYAINPNVTTKRYKISAVDSCGTESELSEFHNTLYCTDLGSGQFFWNLYEIETSANPVLNYVIMRQDTIGAPWVDIDSTAGTQQTLNDPTFASFPDGAWRVKTLWGISCTSTRAGISTSRSNIRTKNSIITNEDEFADPSQALVVYPNPANETIYVNYLGQEQNTVVSLKDATGRIIEQKTINGIQTNFNIHNLQSGIYFIEITTHAGKIVKQVIKS